MKFLSGLFGRAPRQEARAPSEQFPAATDALAHLLDLHAMTPDSWITLIGESRVGTETTIQLAEDSVNLLTTEVDLPAFMESLGLTALADSTRTGGGPRPDFTLWTINAATREELIVLADALLAQHFGLGADYTLTGWVES